MESPARIAYFSMEIALETAIPTYSGGLGGLAGDTLRSAADLRLPLVAVTLLHRKGYFFQRLDAEGNQREEAVEWAVNDFLADTGTQVCIALEGRTVALRAWRYDIRGHSGCTVPVYLLDTDLPENGVWDRALTDHLYGGGDDYRLCQEIVLGLGGLRLLQALGYDRLERFHMNEGHAGFLTLELLAQQAKAQGRALPDDDDVEAVRQQCIFTTHTPVPAGHDKFPLDRVLRVLGDHAALAREDLFCRDGAVNMTYLGFNLSHFINGVAKKHGAVTHAMFPNYPIDWITNGVHAATWVSEPLGRLYGRHMPGWHTHNSALRYALNIPREEVWTAHRAAKRDLLNRINRQSNSGMDIDIFTVGYARRATAYKRPTLLFEDGARLRALAEKWGQLQIVYAGKAHPDDLEGKQLIRALFEIGAQMAPAVRLAYLENYDIDLAQRMTAGVDLWLNTPRPPLEASGTSGMKAAVNGVPSLSVLDGWWLEGCIEGVTGWGIPAADGGAQRDAAMLYEKLERQILPAFYGDRANYIDIMRHAIALNGSFFTTERMMREYVLKAYFL